jgi:hypothetical protein
LAGTALHLLSGIEPGRFPMKRLKPDIHAHLDCDPHLIAILDILLEPSPEDRYSSARSLVNALERWDKATATADPAEATTALFPRVANQLKRPRSGQNRHTNTFSMGGPATPTNATTASLPVAHVTSTNDSTEALSASHNALSGSDDASATGAHEIPSGTAEAIEAPRATGSVDAPAIAVSGAHAGIPSGAHTIAFSPPTEDDGDAAVEEPIEERAENVNDDEADAPSVEADDTSDGATDSDEDDKGASAAEQASEAPPKKLRVEAEDAPILEALRPGGQGASKVGLALAIVGLGLVAVGLFAPLQYNEQVWIIVGSALGVLGIALLAVPRSKAGKAPGADTETTTALLSHIVKRSGPLGSVEWIAEYQYLAGDGLHYDGSFRLPNAAAAREVATDTSRVRVRYDLSDPEGSNLILVKA